MEKIANRSISEIIVLDSAGTIVKDVYEYTYRLARESGLRDVDLNLVTTIEDEVEARLDAICPGPFDRANQADALYLNHITEVVAKMRELQLGEENYARLTKEAKDQVASKTAGTEKPEPSVVLIITAVIALAISFVFTFFEFIFFFLLDEIVRGVFSFLAAIFLGVFTVWLIIAPAAQPTDDRKHNFYSLSGGVVLGLAMLALRLRYAESFQDTLLALGLCGIEIAVVIGLTGYAFYLQKRAHNHLSRQIDVENQSNAEAGIKTCKEGIRDCEIEIAEFHRHVTLRDQLSSRINEIKQAARKTVAVAFAAAVRENRKEYLPV